MQLKTYKPPVYLTIPPQDQHQKAIRTIRAILDKKLEKQDGFGWLNKIFSGKTKEKKWVGK